MILRPNAMQRDMIAFGSKLNRCQLLARPGTGKTAATLTVLNNLSLASSVFPVLVVAPLRVANSVWDGEAQRWTQFKGLRVSRVLGNQDQRRSALKASADVYTIHYGLLKWLAEVLGNKWPFKTVVCDEATRIANHRCSYRKRKSTGQIEFRQAGAVNAAALMQYAKRTPHWINLTGSFTTNGLVNAWGQSFAMDFGSALGYSFSAFKERWFRPRFGTRAEQEVLEPLPWAMEEITKRIAPFSLSIDPKDYMDIRAVNVVDVPVELPPVALKQYHTLRDKAVLELSSEKAITAVNAGAKAMKLLAVACGHVYDENGQPHHVHDAKLDALQGLVEELNGAPLLVCYQFTADKAAILRRFPEATDLPVGARQKQVEDDWNAGKIKMLVVHPASCGHGLSLQHGGCDVAFYGTGWNAELYEQVIERIGPMRQMQSGYDRVVTVYRLLASGTLDSFAAEKVAGRIVSGEEVMEALKR